MKKFITLTIILITMANVMVGQKTISDNFYRFDKGEKVYGDKKRTMFDVGAYRFERHTFVKDAPIHGRQYYINECDVDEVDELVAHIERNKKYYKNKYGFIIENVYVGKAIYTGTRHYKCVTMVIVFPDWDAYEKAEIAKKEETKQRLESINW